MPLIELDNAKKLAQSEEFTKFKSDPMLLYKSCQSEKISVSQYLEKIDPTPRDDEGKALYDCDAFERFLMVNDIKLHGPNQVTVEKLANEVEFLLPELILRTIKEGMSTAERFNPLDCIAVTVPSSTSTYHPLYIPNLNLSAAASRRDKSFGQRSNVGGGEFPVVSIRKREKSISIDDNGRQIEAAYNIVRDYGWEDLAIFLRLLGAQFAIDELHDIYDLGITGDGTVGAATDTFNGAAGSLVYQDLVRNYTMYDAPFVMDRILGPQTTVETILAMAQFQDPLAGWEFQKNGKVVTPMGAKIKQVGTTPNNTPTGTVAVTLDSKHAVRKVEYQPLSIEADKIIARRYERAVASQASKYCVIADGALKRIVWT